MFAMLHNSKFRIVHRSVVFARFVLLINIFVSKNIRSINSLSVNLQTVIISN